MSGTTKKAFWHKSRVAVLGGGSWGTVLAQLASKNCEEVRIWVREEDKARTINSTRSNLDYLPDLKLSERVHAYSDPERVFEGRMDAVIWALPSEVSRIQARRLARVFHGDEMILHATKGVESQTMKRISQILEEELPVRRIGVISGPNLAREIALGEPAATVIASHFNEVVEFGRILLSGEAFEVVGSRDVVGVEWGGVLKNIYAIAAGALEQMGLGLNARSLLMTRGLEEMMRFGRAMGAQDATFAGLAGVGDLIATCGSSLSRNFRVGKGLASGQALQQVMEELGSTAEGVRTAMDVADFSKERGIDLPVTQAVARLLRAKTLSSEESREILLRSLQSVT